MPVPLLDLRVQLDSLGDQLRDAVLQVVDSGRYILGPAVESLETNIAAQSGVAHGIGMSSGTDALLCALMALGVGPGDRVLVPAYSFFATAGAVARLGATPVFLDVKPDTLNLDPAAVSNWFDANDARAHTVKAIIPVHLFGQCADMTPLLALARERNIPIVEDAAQAIGATYPTPDNEILPAGSFGLCTCYSFYPTKNLGGIGDGGMMVTNDAGFADRLRMFRNHGARNRYYHVEIGGNFRLDEIQAAALLVKLKYLAGWNAARRERAAYYDEHLPDTVTRPAAVYGREHHIYHQYVVRVPATLRDNLRKHLTDRGIGNEVFYPVPFHLQECFAGLGYKSGDLPVSEAAAASSVALPMYPELTRPQQDEVIAAIAEFFA